MPPAPRIITGYFFPSGLALSTCWALTVLGAAASPSENRVTWTTNYYPVTGHTSAALRQSINHARPGGRSSRTDAVTVWNVRWRYRLQEGDSGCRLNAFRTETTITMHLPAWNAPSQVGEDVKKSWARYYSALLRHETGHARFALEAEAEIRRRVSALKSDPHCGKFRQSVESLAASILAQARQREQDYDRRTRHGMQDGAFFP